MQKGNNVAKLLLAISIVMLGACNQITLPLEDQSKTYLENNITKWKVARKLYKCIVSQNKIALCRKTYRSPFLSFIK